MGRRLLAVVVMSLMAAAWAAAPTYFVKADMVRAAEGAMGPVCVPNTVFVPGEKIVFRAAVIDAATGEELTLDQIQARGIQAVVKFEGHDDIGMFFPDPSGPDMPPGPSFFRGPWVIPADAPVGTYSWHVEVTDAQGNAATFEPIGMAFGSTLVTIQAAAQ